MRTAIGIGADRVRGARPHRVIASRKNRQKVVRPPPPPPPPDRSMLVLLLLYGDDGLMRSCHGACALTRRLWRPACAHPLPTGSVAPTSSSSSPSSSSSSGGAPKVKFSRLGCFCVFLALPFSSSRLSFPTFLASYYAACNVSFVSL